MALFQPFKSATQRSGSAVGDMLTQSQLDAAEREMMAQNIQGAAQLAQWGLGKETSPWADSIYGPATPEGQGAGPQIDPNILDQRNAEAAALRAPAVAGATAPQMSAVDIAMSQPQQNNGLGSFIAPAAGLGMAFATGNPMFAMPAIQKGAGYV